MVRENKRAGDEENDVSSGTKATTKYYRSPAKLQQVHSLLKNVTINRSESLPATLDQESWIYFHVKMDTHIRESWASLFDTFHWIKYRDQVDYENEERKKFVSLEFSLKNSRVEIMITWDGHGAPSRGRNLTWKPKIQKMPSTVAYVPIWTPDTEPRLPNIPGRVKAENQTAREIGNLKP